MARIIGVDIPDRKKASIAFTYIYGVGPKRAHDICKGLNIDPDKKIEELTDTDIASVNAFIQDHFIVEGDLRREVSQNIRRLNAIGCYRGLRHKRGLPVNGQRTKTNARTRKGPKRTVGAIRDKAARKMSRTD